MVQLGFLVSRVVKNSKPTGELDILKLEHQVAYSWEELPAWGKKFYDKHTCLLLGAIFQNKYLQDAISTFRTKFGIPEGIPLEGNTQQIFRAGKGYQYKYDTLISQYEKAENYIKRFSRNFIVPNPLKVQLRTLFYSGFVTPSIVEQSDELRMMIPVLPKRTTNTVYQYRPAIKIYLNSSNITKEQMHRLVDDNWPKIAKYFKQNPHVFDIGLSEEKLFLLANYAIVPDKQELAEKMDVLYPMEARGKSSEQRNPDSLRKEYSRALKVIQQLIRPK